MLHMFVLHQDPEEQALTIELVERISWFEDSIMLTTSVCR